MGMGPLQARRHNWRLDWHYFEILEKVRWLNRNLCPTLTQRLLPRWMKSGGLRTSLRLAQVAESWPCYQSCADAMPAPSTID